MIGHPDTIKHLDKASVKLFDTFDWSLYGKME